MSTITDNIRSVKSRIEKAAARIGRQPSSIKLIAATKGVPVNLIEEAINAGLTDIGENRVQEAALKFDQLKKYQVTWHMIGHLQTNKVKQALEMFTVIQSIDSERLAKEISNKAPRPIEVFMEVNTSGEASKNGISPDNAVKLAAYICKQPNLRLSGLMTIGPLTDNEQETRKSFRLLKELSDSIKALKITGLDIKYLSMGMSQDFEIAIEEGSSLVRMGRAIFPHPHTPLH